MFDETYTNLRVYERHTKDVNQAAVKGFNGTVFAYGQTSSGKTFTMKSAQLLIGILDYPQNWFEGHKEQVIDAVTLTTLDFVRGIQHLYVPLASVLNKLWIGQLL